MVEEADVVIVGGGLAGGLPFVFWKWPASFVAAC